MAGRLLFRVFIVLGLCVLTVSPARLHAAERARGRLLVSPAWLSSHLEDPDLVLLHVGAEAAYRTAHIAGARRARTWRVRATDTDGFNDMGANDLTLEFLPDSDVPAVLAHYGITARSRVVVYFGKDEYTSATRLILALKRAGLGDRTSLLQGGLPAWMAGGYAVTSDIAVPTTSEPGALVPERVSVDAAFVQANSGKPGFALVDAREPDVFAGVPGANKADPGQPAGHIAGAMNIPDEAVFAADGTLRSAEDLRKVFRDAGVQSGDTVVAYCYTGQRATAVMFAAETLGFKTLLYDGSAEDWSARKLPFTVKK